MSILHSLLRYIDPIGFRQKQEERRREREAVPPDLEGDDIGLPPPRPDAAHQPLVCRLCGHRGGAEHRYCPRCLAETMERRR